MKTVIRGLLVALLLVVSLLVVLSGQVTGQLDRLVIDPAQRRAAVFLLVALAGVVSDTLAFVLVPARSSWLRQLFHALGIGAVFVAGLYGLGRTGPPAPAVAPGLFNLNAGWPILALAGIGFVGYLVVSTIIRPTTPLARVLSRHLQAQEKALCHIQQTRWKHPVTPDTLVATNQRLIVYRPTNLGFTSTLEDYNYVDIANVKIERGFLFSNVLMTERFEGDDLQFRGMPKGGAEQFVRTVTDQLRLQRGGPMAGLQAAPEAGGADAEAGRILQRRLAAGEITAAEYEKLLDKMNEERGE